MLRDVIWYDFRCVTFFPFSNTIKHIYICIIHPYQVIVFQNQRLSLLHILLILSLADKLAAIEVIDEMMKPSDKKNNPSLYKNVVRTMIPGPIQLIPTLHPWSTSGQSAPNTTQRDSVFKQYNWWKWLCYILM